MKCIKCAKEMKFVKKLRFNEYEVEGWQCACGETYYESESAQRVLLLNKLKKDTIHVKLGRIRSNLILRLPREVEKALNLEKGEEVKIKIEGKTLKIIPA